MVLRKLLSGVSVFLFFVLVVVQPAPAQETRLAPQWWFGGALGLNYNFYSGNVQSLAPGVTGASPFTKGSGAGLFLAPLLEYRPDPVWGGMLTLGFDSRRGSFNDVGIPGGTQSLSTAINYLSLEPSVRITPFSNNLYFFAGPRLGFTLAKSFSYSQTGAAASEGDWSSTRGTVVSAQIGAGYDIPLSDPDAGLQTQLSPFFSFHIGQGPRSSEDWSLSTVRFGVALKFGTSTQLHARVASEINFTIKSPKIIPGERRVKETFPMRNDLFFDEGSADIPSRYELLTEDKAKDFKEEALLQPEPKDLNGRSRRQLTVYHNVLNIVGDRLRRNPDAAITLLGAAPEGAERGKAEAEAVKKYLVGIFGIADNRIAAEGRLHPEHPSWQPGGTRELDLVQAEDRRVDIASSTEQILQPVQIISLQEEPLDNDVIFDVSGAQDLLASWTLELTDQDGHQKQYGPYTTDEERVSGKEILAGQPEGTYSVVLLAQTKAGQTIRKEDKIRLAKSEIPEDSLGLRFSILFEFDESKTVATYTDFLTKTVAPLIKDNGSVIIHGHTDIIGEESHNLKLSQDRAHETQRILEGELSSEGKTHVKFDTYGFGEDPRRAPFDNRLPEERFYNRTVIIDVLPEQ